MSRRQVHLLLRRWRDGEGVVSDLIPRRSSWGCGRGHLPDEVEAVIRDLLRTRYLTRQKRSVAAVRRELARICRSRGWPVPSRGTLARRIARLDPVSRASAREGPDAARALRAAGGPAPPVAAVLEQVQIDHTVVDVIVVDERHRLPVGRPYVTAGIDVFSRCIVGLVVTLEAPSALSAGLCLAHGDGQAGLAGAPRGDGELADERAGWRPGPARPGGAGRRWQPPAVPGPWSETSFLL